MKHKHTLKGTVEEQLVVLKMDSVSQSECITKDYIAVHTIILFCFKLKTASVSYEQLAYEQFLQSNFFIYAMNLMTLVKLYRHNVFAIIWHRSKL